MTDAPRTTGDATDGTGAGASTGIAAVRLERWTVTSGSNVNSRAAVVIRAGDHDWKASAEGNGGVDALFKAVDQALAPILGGHPLLLAYDVHALAEGPDAEGRVTIRVAPPVSARGDRADGRFTGEVTSTNTIAASVEAYIHALNEMLGGAPWAGAAEDAGGRRGRSRGDTQPSPTEYDTDATKIDTTEWFNR